MSEPQGNKSEDLDLAKLNGLDSVFPGLGPNDNRMYGITKRELFAALAMQGLISNSANRGEAEMAAAISVACADALLKELAK